MKKKATKIFKADPSHLPHRPLPIHWQQFPLLEDVNGVNRVSVAPLLRDHW
jgi:hypothetical protein